MAKIIPIRGSHKPDTVPLVRREVTEERRAFIARVATTDPDLLACVEAEMAGSAQAPQDTADRIKTLGVEKVKSDVQLYHGLSDFEFKLVQNLCEAAIKEKLGLE